MYQPSERARHAPGRGYGLLLNALFLGLVAAGVVVWLFGFGGANGIRDTVERVHFSSASPWVSLLSPHQDVADSAVLNVGDLPPGWLILPDDEDDFEPDKLSSDYCKALEKKASSEGIDATAPSDTMGGPDNQRLFAEASVFSSSEDSQRSLDNLREFFSRCSADYIAQFEDGFRRGAANDGIVLGQVQMQTTITEVPPPAVGESGLAYRINAIVTGPGGSFEFIVDIIAFRIGRMDAGLVYSQIGGPRPEEQQQILQTAAAKLEAANATLTEG